MGYDLNRFTKEPDARILKTRVGDLLKVSGVRRTEARSFIGNLFEQT